MKRLPLIALVLLSACASAPESAELAAWKTRAAGVTIVRDDWGVPHITGKTDADAIFGLMYAQAEDDFHRVETNFINAMGRLAEAEGEGEIYRDLRMKLFIDPETLKAQYGQAPAWLKSLMDAWADGLNYYLATHPEVTPRVITRFEPWMALSFSEGSIGGDIESVSLAQLEALYGPNPAAQARVEPDPVYSAAPPEPTGSNGFALAPRLTADGKALLVINPHTSFFFREEAQVTSEEGLNAYGALTWGQFFVYQGFNDRVGWMHTSSGVDNIDEFLLTTEQRGGQLVYRFGNEERPLQTRTITVPYKTATGMASRTFTVYRSHHGPVVRRQDGRMVAVRLMEEPLKALIQSFSRTKARTLAEYKRVMEAHTNSSNNTLYADADGNIAYFHSNFVPRRDTRYDYSKPVEGSLPATDWQGVHSYAESPNVENPSTGWVYNTNNWPYTAAGADSPVASRYPAYFDRAGENPRGVHAIRLMQSASKVTLDGLVQMIFDPQQPEFEMQVPQLIDAWDRAAAAHPLKARLKAPVDALRGWDARWAVTSVPQTLAYFWAEALWASTAEAARAAGVTVYEFMRTRATPAQRLEALATVVDRLTADFGTWNVPWGDINRFQRISPALVHPFDDAQPSIPVGFASARWGSLASFGARRFNGSKKIYGTSGNSFVAVVEFGKDGVRARAVTAGGLSSDVTSKHFNDQATRYATGDLREVYFYPSQLNGHTERRYSPGR